MDRLIPLGTETEFGKIVAIGFPGERYYWCIQNGCVSMIPGSVLENSLGKDFFTHQGDTLAGE